jgi:hypothetical protein
MSHAFFKNTYTLPTHSTSAAIYRHVLIPFSNKEKYRKRNAIPYGPPETEETSDDTPSSATAPH